MAKCDQGYICDVCHQEVARLNESSLYLRYIVGDISANMLAVAGERHLSCDPFIAQFIDHPSFPPMTCEGPFGKENLPSDDVTRLTDLYTRGWLRLQYVVVNRMPISEYPLGDVISE